MNDADFLEPGSDESEALHEVQLGDALADDERLERALPGLEVTLNEEAPGTGYRWLIDLWGMCRGYAGTAWTATREAVAWGVRRFSDVEVRRIEARAKADETRILARAKAMEIEAKAALIQADADVLRDQGTAVAEATRIESELKAELLKKLRARGIDWQAQMDDGKLRVLVTKRRDAIDGPRSGG